MSVKVSEMTDLDLRKMIGEVVEEKINALFSIEDNLELNENVIKILKRQQLAVNSGERGESFDDVLVQLELN
jgi:hypothetical protein